VDEEAVQLASVEVRVGHGAHEALCYIDRGVAWQVRAMVGRDRQLQEVVCHEHSQCAATAVNECHGDVAWFQVGDWAEVSSKTRGYGVAFGDGNPAVVG
jgi:hypothetical protein